MEMNLKAYLANNHMTMVEFSSKVDCNPFYLSGIASGRLIAGRRLARDVCSATGGIVKLPTKPKKSIKKNDGKNECNVEV